MQKATVFSLLGALALIAMPLSAQAAEFRSSDTSSVAAGTTINDDLYITGGTVTVDGAVTGDLVVAGGTVTVTGAVGGDIIAAGGEVNLKGSVADDVRVAGGTVRIEGTVGDDVMAAGGTIETGRGSVINGGLWSSSGSLKLAGTSGLVEAQAEDVLLTNTAVINGSLSYMGENELKREDGAVVTGTVDHKLPAPQTAATIFMGALLSFLLSFAFAALYRYFFANKALMVAEDSRFAFWKNLGVGVLFTVIGPIVAFAVLSTLVGAPLALAFFLVYGLIMLKAWVSSVLSLGLWIQRAIERRPELNVTMLSALIGAAALIILKFIPVIGWLLLAIVFLVSVGAVLRFDWNLLKSLRTEKRV